MDPATLAIIALGGALLLGKRSGSTSSRSKWYAKNREDREMWLNEIMAMSNWYSSKFNSMPLLGDYLASIGFIESGFNPAAINNSSFNAARGLFGIRPETAFKKSNGLEFMLGYRNALLNPRWSFVIAVNHIYDACKAVEREGSGIADWAAIRRWWGYPSRVHDFNYSNEWSKSNTEKLEEGIEECNSQYGTNIDPDFIWKDVKRYNNYPGIKIMIKSFGLEGVRS